MFHSSSGQTKQKENKLRNNFTLSNTNFYMHKETLSSPWNSLWKKHAKCSKASMWEAVGEFALRMEDFAVQAALSPLQTCIFSVITLQSCQDFVYQHSLNSSAAKLVMDNLICSTTSLQDNHIMVLSRAYHLESSQDLQHAHRGRKRYTDEKSG